MACPTCEHTMQALVDKYYWCPRCGTIADERSSYRDVLAPVIVNRGRDAVAALELLDEGMGESYRATVERFKECLFTPDQR